MCLHLICFWWEEGLMPKIESGHNDVFTCINILYFAVNIKLVTSQKFEYRRITCCMPHSELCFFGCTSLVLIAVLGMHEDVDTPFIFIPRMLFLIYHCLCTSNTFLVSHH